MNGITTTTYEAIYNFAKGNGKDFNNLLDEFVTWIEEGYTEEEVLSWIEDF